MWHPLTNLSENMSDGNGIVRLWCPANYLDSSGWTTIEDFSNKLWSYFFIPAGFIFDSDNTFKYTRTLKSVYSNININTEHGTWTTFDFWHYEETEMLSSSIKTDLKTKLPYLIVPDYGDPNYIEEKRYFIPCNNTF